MKIGKSPIDYQRTKSDISFTHNVEKSYNEISKNHNKSLQPTENIGFESSRFDLSNVSAAETRRYAYKNKYYMRIGLL